MLLILRKPLLDRGRWLFSRRVTTWSPLAAAFNAKPSSKISWNLAKDNVGLFCIPQLMDYTGFYLLQENVRAETDALVEEISSKNRERKLVGAFDQLSDSLCRVADMADFVRIAHPDKQFSDTAGEICANISSLVEKLNTNVHIHESLRRVINEGDIVPTDAIDKRVAELFMFDFEQSGIHLPEEQRRKFVSLNEQILALGTSFMYGAHQPIAVPKEQLSKQLVDSFTVNGDRVYVTGLFADHHSDLIREAAYKIYLYPDPHQMELLDGLLTARNRLAKLAGFPTFAHRAVRGSLAATPENVMNFLQLLIAKLKPRVEKDIVELKSIKAKHSTSDSSVINIWDATYYSGILRHERCEMDNIALAPYFSLGGCMEGLNLILQSLFGIQLCAEEVLPGEVWNNDVRKLVVNHECEGTLGYIYCDFFERPGKPRQDCHFTIQGGRLKEDNTYQKPIVVLMLNLPRPRGRVPSLLVPGMVENLFHEFGHAIHSMLGRTRYQHVTGTRCATDFAEVPSILMEYFAMDPRCLRQYARHWQTGEQLPANQISNMCRARKMLSALETQIQVFYSLVDQVLHGEHPLRGTTTEVLERLQDAHHCFPHVPATAWQLRFSHFVGYGAKYYSYLMSRAVASRVWHQCFKHDPFSREMGVRYRRSMLAHGGEEAPAKLVQDMLKEAPTIELLANALIEDIDAD